MFQLDAGFMAYDLSRKVNANQMTKCVQTSDERKITIKNGIKLSIYANTRALI